VIPFLFLTRSLSPSISLRCVVLPGVVLRKGSVLGSGSLAPEDFDMGVGSVWVSETLVITVESASPVFFSSLCLPHALTPHLESHSPLISSSLFPPSLTLSLPSSLTLSLRYPLPFPHSLPIHYSLPQVGSKEGSAVSVAPVDASYNVRDTISPFGRYGEILTETDTTAHTLTH
jgi:hypothetical protein